MSNCVFCKIAKGEIKTELLADDKEVIAFRDIKPRAPVHIIIIPREHIERVSDLSEQNSEIVGKMVAVAARLARKEGVESSGYRLVMNCNRDAGQEVFHIHLHLLGGRKLAWPPG